MNYTLTEKILKEHLLYGEMTPGSEIGLRVDQTLTQDSTGTMAYLQWEEMEFDKIRTKCSVAYVDHNMLQESFESADDHLYIQSIAAKYGLYYSRPGNGICHQVHLERFGVPGHILVGSDSHTPTGGALGMLAIGAGGVDVATSMGGNPYYIAMPEIIGVELIGKLSEFVTAKDIILEVLRILTVKGGVGRIIEYKGEGIKGLSVYERATITNMGAELGATTSIFPSDEVTLEFLKAQGRQEVYKESSADKNAVYSKEITIDLSKLVPLVAAPHSPDNVKPINEVEGTAIQQVAIGSCTNSSYADLMKVAEILKGKTVHPSVSLVITPGSKQMLSEITANGALKTIIDAGARILESGCGPCIGMGQAPCSDGVSLRTFNRNFFGRSGTRNAQVYLASPEVAAASAINGFITDPRSLKGLVKTDFKLPQKFQINDNMIIKPHSDNTATKILRGPNIKPAPVGSIMKSEIKGKVLIKVGDNITTDHIMPSTAKLLPYRSNIPYLTDFSFNTIDDGFSKRAKDNNGGFIVGGENYGQGSSREHAALVPLALNIKGVFAKSFARIHKANLINSGILPLIFVNKTDYNEILQMDEILIEQAEEQVKSRKIRVKSSSGKSYDFLLEVSDRELQLLLDGGIINQMRINSDKGGNI